MEGTRIKAASVVAALVPFMLIAAYALLVAPAASAAVPASLHDPANCAAIEPAPGYSVLKCDDGVPPTGGAVPNIGGTDAVTVPATYDGYKGLPGSGGGSVPGSDPDGNIALDVDLTLPSFPPGPGGYPLLFFMHGCCGGDKTNWERDEIDAETERWHYNNSWFASRGYAVVTYTARGFVNGNNRGSTGETQLNHRAFEVNDMQHLACQVLASQSAFSDVTGHEVEIDPSRVVMTGGSYGAGLTWMVITDPKWTCTPSTGAGGERMELAAAAPKYGWTDLVSSLVPTGRHFQTPDRLPATDGCDSGSVDLEGAPCPGETIGVPKLTIVSGLYASGKTGIGPNAPHTTFPNSIDSLFVCLQGVYPPPGACRGTVEAELDDFLNGRSAYYQQRFFNKIAKYPSWRVPIFNSATNTDPLFPGSENRRMLNRLRSIVPDYPIQTYHGDYQHFVQNKAREWGDQCGADNHVCTDSDYPGGNYDADPAGLSRTGATTRMNRFLDHFVRPVANDSEPEPNYDVTSSLQVCPDVSGGDPAKAGRQFTAPTFEQLTDGFLDIDLSGRRSTANKLAPNSHATNADPVANSVTNGGACAIETAPAGSGVATYESVKLDRKRTMLGATRVTARFDPAPGAGAVELNARLYDVLPEGKALLVDRGPRVLRPAELADGRVEFELHGNGWRFRKDHKIRIELAQDDDPFVKFSSDPASLDLRSVEIVIPVREQVRRRCGNRRTGDHLDNRFLLGGVEGDRIKGHRGNDRARGSRGRDCVNGGGDEDLLFGGRGADKVTGGSGRDTMVGGRGNDRMTADDGSRDRVFCGPGRDVVRADRIDRVRGCERKIIV